MISQLCEEEFPDDINCFMLCFYSKFQKYDPIHGFNVTSIKEQLGSQAYSPTDWTHAKADKIIDKCLENVFVGSPGLKTQTCNPDIRAFGTCYWEEMFKHCPYSLRGNNCL